MAMTTEERNLILIQALSFFAASLASIFINVFFFRYGSFQVTMLYGTTVMASLVFWMVVSGFTLRHVSSGFLMRMGLIASVVFHLLLFFLKDQSVLYVIPLGFLQGFVQGNYWAGYNLNQYIFTNKEKRHEYFGTTTSILNVLQALAPFIGGAIITFTQSYTLFGTNLGYPALFFITAIILGITALVVGKLPSHEAPHFSYTHIFSHKRSGSWRNLLLQQTLLGFYDSSLSTVTGILIYIIVKKEISLGAAQTTAYLLGALGSLISIRLLRNNFRFYWIGICGLVIGILSFAFFQTLDGVIVFILFTGITAPFLNNQLSINILSAFDRELGSWKEKYHLLIERDTVLGVARMTSYIGLYFFLSGENQAARARLWLFVIPVILLLLGLVLSNSNMKKRSEA